MYAGMPKKQNELPPQYYPAPGAGGFPPPSEMASQGHLTRGQFPLPHQGHLTRGQFPLPHQGQFGGQFPLPHQGQFTGAQFPGTSSQFPGGPPGQFPTAQFPLTKGAHAAGAAGAGVSGAFDKDAFAATENPSKGFSKVRPQYPPPPQFPGAASAEGMPGLPAGVSGILVPGSSVPPFPRAGFPGFPGPPGMPPNMQTPTNNMQGVPSTPQQASWDPTAPKDSHLEDPTLLKTGEPTPCMTNAFTPPSGYAPPPSGYGNQYVVQNCCDVSNISNRQFDRGPVNPGSIPMPVPNTSMPNTSMHIGPHLVPNTMPTYPPPGGEILVGDNAGDHEEEELKNLYIPPPLLEVNAEHPVQITEELPISSDGGLLAPISAHDIGNIGDFFIPPPIADIIPRDTSPIGHLDGYESSSNPSSQNQMDINIIESSTSCQSSSQKNTTSSQKNVSQKETCFVKPSERSPPPTSTPPPPPHTRTQPTARNYKMEPMYKTNATKMEPISDMKSDIIAKMEPIYKTGIVVSLEEIAFFLDDLERNVWWLLKLAKLHSIGKLPDYCFSGVLGTNKPREIPNPAVKKKDASKMKAAKAKVEEGGDDEIHRNNDSTKGSSKTLLVNGDERLPPESDYEHEEWVKTFKSIERKVGEFVQAHENLKSKMFLIESPTKEEKELLDCLSLLRFQCQGRIVIFEIKRQVDDINYGSFHMTNKDLFQELHNALMEKNSTFARKCDIANGTFSSNPYIMQTLSIVPVFRDKTDGRLKFYSVYYADKKKRFWGFVTGDIRVGGYHRNINMAARRIWNETVGVFYPFTYKETYNFQEEKDLFRGRAEAAKDLFRRTSNSDSNNSNCDFNNRARSERSEGGQDTSYMTSTAIESVTTSRLQSEHTSVKDDGVNEDGVKDCINARYEIESNRTYSVINNDLNDDLRSDLNHSIMSRTVSEAKSLDNNTTYGNKFLGPNKHHHTTYGNNFVGPNKHHHPDIENFLYIAHEKDGSRYPVKSYLFLPVSEKFYQYTREEPVIDDPNILDPTPLFLDFAKKHNLPTNNTNFVRHDERESTQLVHKAGYLFKSFDEAAWLDLDYETGVLKMDTMLPDAPGNGILNQHRKEPIKREISVLFKQQPARMWRDYFTPLLERTEEEVDDILRSRHQVLERIADDGSSSSVVNADHKNCSLLMSGIDKIATDKDLYEFFRNGNPDCNVLRVERLTEPRHSARVDFGDIESLKSGLRKDKEYLRRRKVKIELLVLDGMCVSIMNESSILNQSIMSLTNNALSFAKNAPSIGTTNSSEMKLSGTTIDDESIAPSPTSTVVGESMINSMQNTSSLQLGGLSLSDVHSINKDRRYNKPTGIIPVKSVNLDMIKKQLETISEEGPFRIVCKNLDRTVSTNDLGYFFWDRDCECEQVILGDGFFRHYGFVEFSDKETLLKSLEWNDVVFKGRPLNIAIDTGEFEHYQERREELEIRHPEKRIAREEREKKRLERENQYRNPPTNINPATSTNGDTLSRDESTVDFKSDLSVTASSYKDTVPPPMGDSFSVPINGISEAFPSPISNHAVTLSPIRSSSGVLLPPPPPPAPVSSGLLPLSSSPLPGLTTPAPPILTTNTKLGSSPIPTPRLCPPPVPRSPLPKTDGIVPNNSAFKIFKQNSSSPMGHYPPLGSPEGLLGNYPPPGPLDLMMSPPPSEFNSAHSSIAANNHSITQSVTTRDSPGSSNVSSNVSGGTIRDTPNGMKHTPNSVKDSPERKLYRRYNKSHLGIVIDRNDRNENRASGEFRKGESRNSELRERNGNIENRNENRNDLVGSGEKPRYERHQRRNRDDNKENRNWQRGMVVEERPYHQRHDPAPLRGTTMRKKFESSNHSNHSNHGSNYGSRHNGSNHHNPSSTRSNAGNPNADSNWRR